MSIMTFGIHTCRKVDPRHIRNLLGKLKVEDPEVNNLIFKINNFYLIYLI